MHAIVHAGPHAELAQFVGIFAVPAIAKSINAMLLILTDPLAQRAFAAADHVKNRVQLGSAAIKPHTLDMPPFTRIARLLLR